MIVTHNIDCACYRCKLLSLNFDRGRPKTHIKNGDPWKDNPVAERIDELRAQGKKVAAFEINKEGTHADV